MKLNHDELMLARKTESWETLWLQAVPLARLTVRRLKEHGTLDPSYLNEDLLQDALLAAGEAIRSWDPRKGRFSTWVMAYTRGTLLKKVASAATGMVGGRDNGYFVTSMHGWQDTSNALELDESTEFGAEATLAYEEPPEGFRDPCEEVVLMQEKEQLAQLLQRLPQKYSEMLSCVYGIDGLAETQEEYSKRKGIPLRTVKWQLSRGLQALAFAFKE